MKNFDQLWALLRYRLLRITPIALLRTFPATILLVATVICCGLVTEGESRATYLPTLNRLGIDYDKLMNGHIVNIFTSTFLQTKPGIAPSMIVVITSAFLLCELFAGSVRLIVIFFLSDWFATLMSIATLRILAAFHDQASIGLLSVPDAGTSATAHGAYAVAAMALLPRRLAFAGYGLLLGVTFVLFFEQKPDASMAHLSSSLLGGALGWFVFRPKLLAESDERGEQVRSGETDLVTSRRPTTDGDLPKTVASLGIRPLCGAATLARRCMIDELQGHGSDQIPGPPRQSGRAAGGSVLRSAFHRLRRVDAAVWGVLVILLAIVFVWSQRADVRQIIDVIRNASGWWLLAVFTVAIGLHLGFVVTQSLILRTLGHHIPFIPAVTTYAERQVVATVVPLGSAPSLVILARRFAPFGVTNEDAVYSVLLFSLLGHSSFMTYLLPVLLWLIISQHATTAIIGAAIILLAIVLVALGIATALLADRGIPAGLRSRIPAPIHGFLESVRGHDLRPRDLAPSYLVALTVDGCGVLALFLALRAVGADVSLGVAAAGYTVGTLFQLIAPIFQGVGVVEFSMTIVLQQLGVPASQALGATLIYRVALIWLPVLFGVAFQARHQKRLIGYPARLPAIWTGVNGLIAILSVMPHPTYHRISDIRRPPDVGQLDVVHLDNASRSITLTIGFLLILLSFGLWRRQRTAWLAAVILSAIVVVSHFLKGHDHIGGFLALASIVPLLIYRDRFRVRSDRPTIQRGLTFAAAAIVLALAYGVCSLWFLDRHQFGYDFSLWSSISQTVDLYTSVNSAGLMPQTVYAHWLVNSFHLIGILTVGVAAVSLIRPYVWKRAVYPAEQRRARDLIVTHGSASDDFFKYAGDKSFFFSDEGSGVVSYGVSTGTALVLGDPVAPDPSSIEQTLGEFLDFVDAHGWHPAFHHATPGHLQIYRDAGLIPLKIGAEAIVDLDAFTLAGKHGQNFRSTIARFTRDGYQAVFTEPPISPERIAQLREVSNEWLTLDGRRERSFTLGHFTDDYVTHSPIISLESADGTIEAFMNVIPDGVPGEITFDLMRHRVTAPNSSVDFVVLSAFRYAQERGFHRASLGMVPFAEVGTDPNAALRERALSRLTERFNQYFAATSLYAYKDKFHPTWEPRYLVYSGDAWLPSIGLAISRLTEKPLADPPSAPPPSPPGVDHDP